MLTRTHAFTVPVPHSRQEVWDWFARPGAFHRLAAPWTPLQPLEEARSLADGRAVLQAKVATASVPRGRWVAQHQPDDYIEGSQFGDHCVSQPFSAITGWKHLHRFEGDDASCRLIDQVTTRVPKSVLTPMFRYRGRQVTDDLNAHAAAARQWEAKPSTIAITGARGLVGTALTAFLSTGGHRVIHLVRGEPDPDAIHQQRHWDLETPDPAILDGVDAVVHLAGETIAGRFTAEHMSKVHDSRVGPTRRLAEAIVQHGGPRVFASASAIGFYGSEHTDELLDESSPSGDDFLASVVRGWEQATSPASDAGVRTVLVRTGLVQSARGGLLAVLRPLYEAFLGGRLGDGQQWMSWIAIDDLIDVYHRAIFDDVLAGPVNAVAPQPLRNEEFSKVLASVISRPSSLAVPKVGPQVLLGQRGARELALASQRVVPAALIDAGHRFRHPGLREALQHELGRTD